MKTATGKRFGDEILDQYGNPTDERWIWLVDLEYYYQHLPFKSFLTDVGIALSS